MRYTIFALISLVVISMTVGCGPRFSTLLTESWSENYALASYGAEASHPRINDGDIKTWDVTRPPDRLYTVTLPEERQIDRVVIYIGNVVSYKLLYWDKKADKWKVAVTVGSLKGSQRVYSERRQLEVPRFDHRVKFRTDKIRLQVSKAESDGVVTTRTPGKDDKILNHRVEYLGTGRGRVRVDLYDIYKLGPASVREIEAYSHTEKPKAEQN